MGGTSNAGGAMGGTSNAGAAGDAFPAGGDSGGAPALPDASCVAGCEVSPLSTACTSMASHSVSWGCPEIVTESLRLLRDAGCVELATQVPRFCCDVDFRPCE
jgi:hypothetical protein